MGMRVDYGWTPCDEGMRVKAKITAIGQVIRTPNQVPVVTGWAVTFDGTAKPTPMPQTRYSKTLGGYTVEELEEIAVKARRKRNRERWNNPG